VIDQWRDGGQALYEGEVILDETEHEVVVEYYERGQQALIRFGYVPAALPSATPSETPSATLAPPTEEPTPAETQTPAEAQSAVPGP
ncbi:MAG: hypothetical protein GX657_08225, partial [Chloroflexi bacterium]|nr:hypothetical protein [Chloroflexota bacterium]